VRPGPVARAGRERAPAGEHAGVDPGGRRRPRADHRVDSRRGRRRPGDLREGARKGAARGGAPRGAVSSGPGGCACPSSAAPNSLRPVPSCAPWKRPTAGLSTVRHQHSRQAVGVPRGPSPRARPRGGQHPLRRGHRPGPPPVDLDADQRCMVPRRDHRLRPAVLAAAALPGPFPWPTPSRRRCATASCTPLSGRSAVNANGRSKSRRPGPGPTSSKPPSWPPSRYSCRPDPRVHGACTQPEEPHRPVNRRHPTRPSGTRPRPTPKIRSERRTKITAVHSEREPSHPVNDQDQWRSPLADAHVGGVQLPARRGPSSGCVPQDLRERTVGESEAD
jgi:hypothetical protein